MRLEYIQANGVRYYPQEPGEKLNDTDDAYLPVCEITPLDSGVWHVYFYDGDSNSRYYKEENQTPNTKVVLYPKGIEEIRYTYSEYNQYGRLRKEHYMKPEGRLKKVKGSPWKVDTHPGKGLCNWWERLCDTVSRRTIKRNWQKAVDIEISENN